jgi:radical SAM superfamily enzyme YgiQ (UPF0313 family)
VENKKKETIMKILLVLPASENLRVRRPDEKAPKREMLRFSVLPLLTVASLTPGGHEVEICDENVSYLNFDRPCDLVGVGFMTALAPRAYKIAREFRKRGRTLVAGGYHPTLMPEEVLEHFDAVLSGDAEGAWPRLIDDFKKGRLQRRYSQTGAEAGRISGAKGARALLAPTSRFYATPNAVQAGRGCVHNCRYCSVTAFHKGCYRHRPLEEIVCEVKALKGDFIFVDDNIVSDEDFATGLFKALKPLGRSWVSQCSIKIADNPGLLRLAAESGCRGLFIGIESLSAQNMLSMDKGFNDNGTYEEKIKRIRRQGIGVIAGIIVGMDFDGRDVFAKTLEFLRECHVDAIQLNIMTPLPGTPLFEDFQQKGRIRSRDWSLYDFRHVVMEPMKMSPGELQDGADWLYASFYSLPAIISRALNALLVCGLQTALLSLKLGLTYRYDIVREGICGRDPQEHTETSACNGSIHGILYAPKQLGFLLSSFFHKGRMEQTKV